jgi:hypothetical protein
MGLESGFDDDDEELHQYVHICWPYASKVGALCDTKRLWFHGGPIVTGVVLGTEAAPRVLVDCTGCFAELELLMRTVPREDWPIVIKRLTDAVDSLTRVRNVAQGILDAHENSPEYVAALKHGYPETTLAHLKEAIDADHARHVAAWDEVKALEVAKT